MPDLSRTPSHQQYQQHISVPLASTMSYYQNPQQLQGFYGDLSRAGAGGIPMASYDPYAVSAVPSLQMPTTSAAMGGPVGGPLPTQHRASSGAWNQQDDTTLLQLRAMGKNWNQIQREAFPGKTGNACRKRHERLMERRGQNDFDNRKLERLCKEYMSMRKEIWQGLASRCGEKWNVVEMQCMSNGLKNIQSHARAYARRERLESGQSLGPYDDTDNGMCLTPIDDPDMDGDGADQSYSSPETGSSTGGPQSTPGAGSSGGSAISAGSSHHQPYASLHHGHGHHHSQHHSQHHHSQAYGAQGYGGYGHAYSNSVSSTGSAPGGDVSNGRGNGGSSGNGTSPYLGNGRLPSIGDMGSMGIDAIINRGQPN
ncbi:hypothetical protein VTJ49DRAFT_6389 [Mycothermus thermophilus]|uniref:Myb-like domain-containing protein n=1 Tax=Humicola insolens TaxID=85995 RepID=A0ABR3VR43_HUMIN